MTEKKKAMFHGQEVLGRECRFAVFCEPPEGERDDVHLVKEVVHLADGTMVPNVRLIYNFERPFWVTKPAFRNHKDKKEWEHVDRVDRFVTTQSQLNNTIKRGLGLEWMRNGNDYRKLARSPYLYGSDILSTAVIKKAYQIRWNQFNTPYSNAAFDTEKDVIYGTEEINMATVSYKDRVYTAVQRRFVEGLANVEKRARETLERYLTKIDAKTKDKDGKEVDIVVNVLEERGIKWELEIVDSEIDIVRRCFQKAHEWKPDFLSIWNINFDIPFIIEACGRAGIDPKEIFSDPCVPEQYRFAYYKEGPRKKKTASGKEMPIKPADQWHTLFCPSSFYVIDAMCVYKKVRAAKGEEPSYALDAILDKNLGMRKLKFKEADGYTGLDWHVYMQENHKLEYIVYNVFDCISMEILDEKTKDLQIALPMQSGCSDFENFKSQPRRTADALHFYVQEHGKVFGSTSDEMANEMDEMTISNKDWIVTLPAHLVADNGLCVIEEYPDLRTNIRAHVGDLDVSASYPNGECVFNISKETTHRELCKIQGVPEIMQRMQGINLSGGHTNAVEVCSGLFKMPTMEEFLKSYDAHLGR